MSSAATIDTYSTKKAYECEVRLLAEANQASMSVTASTLEDVREIVGVASTRKVWRVEEKEDAEASSCSARAE